MPCTSLTLHNDGTWEHAQGSSVNSGNTHGDISFASRRTAKHDGFQLKVKLCSTTDAGDYWHITNQSDTTNLRVNGCFLQQGQPHYLLEGFKTEVTIVARNEKTTSPVLTIFLPVALPSENTSNNNTTTSTTTKASARSSSSSSSSSSRRSSSSRSRQIVDPPPSVLRDLTMSEKNSSSKQRQSQSLPLHHQHQGRPLRPQLLDENTPPKVKRKLKRKRTNGKGNTFENNLRGALNNPSSSSSTAAPVVVRLNSICFMIELYFTYNFLLFSSRLAKMACPKRMMPSAALHVVSTCSARAAPSPAQISTRW